MDLQTNADLDPQLLTGLPRLLYISKALVSKLFYEDIKPEHCTEEPLSSFISNHIYYIQLTCFYSKLDAANAQWPEFQDRLRRILLKIFEAQSNPAQAMEGAEGDFLGCRS